MLDNGILGFGVDIVDGCNQCYRNQQGALTRGDDTNGVTVNASTIEW